MASSTTVLPQADLSLPKASTPREAALRFATPSFAETFNIEPLATAHNLSGLEIFSYDYLRNLAEKYLVNPSDAFVASSALSANADFNSVPHGQHAPHVAMTLLDQAPYRVLLKRPEKYDTGFKELIEALFASIADAKGGFGDDKIVRLESSVFVSSAKTTTPIHFDPEVGFFCQIAGEKIYHVYPPANVTEAELEPFYIKSSVEIGKVDVNRRDPAREHVFHLAAGKGLHQPQNAPHWVETCSSQSISYSVVLETESTRALGRTRAFNHYIRRTGMAPSEPGRHPATDAMKANAMNAILPMRKLAGKVVRSVKGQH
ncbi:MAG: hypothetical protein JSS95_05975 [Acidobacteria bacterium]|nr:hypothetical protein [Acidobacteriota bacterium]